MKDRSVITRESFAVRKSKLKRGIAISWFINFLILACTIEACLIFAGMKTNSTNDDIVTFILVSSPCAIIVSAIALCLVSYFSWKAIMYKFDMVKVEPNVQKVLDNIVTEMSIAGQLSQDEIPTIGVIESKEPNAFALSGPHGSVVCVTTALLDTLNREELQGVIAHEVGHLIAGDSRAMTKLIAISSIVGIISGGAWRFMDRSDSDSKNPIAIVIIGIAFLFLIFSPILAALANASMQRKRESQADAISVQLTRDPNALALALMKISGTYDNMSSKDIDVSKDVKQLAFFSGKHYRTHPPVEERIYELRRMGASV